MFLVNCPQVRDSVFAFLFIILSGNTLFAGEPIRSKVSTDYELSFKEKYFFHQLRSEWQFGRIPAFDVDRIMSDGRRVAYGPHTVAVISLGGIGYEPRINLLDLKDKASISISVPFDFSLGLSVSEPNDAVNTGFFAASMGFFLDANYGNHSTFNNIDPTGIGFGIGWRVHKAPLIGIPDGDYKFSRLSGGPAMRVQYKLDQKNKRNRVFYVESGIPEYVETENGGYRANLYLMVGIGTLLDY